jgi:hypothetical protein
MEFFTVEAEESEREKLEEAMRKNEESLRQLHDLLIDMESVTPKPEDDLSPDDRHALQR